MYADRFARLRAAMATADVEAVLLSVGPDLPWLIGYEAMPLERLTMLVVPRDDDATLVVPRLEVPRVRPRGDLFAIRGWDETDDPVAIVAELLGATRRAAVGDRTWARFLIELQVEAPAVRFGRAAAVLGPLRAVKDADEVDALRSAAVAADRVAADLQGGEIALVGRSEADVSAEIGRRLLAEGHHRVNFAIVAAGSNAASPHHEPGDRTIGVGEVVLCDFGGTWYPDGPGEGAGYCSDITRCVHVGPVPVELAEAYAALDDAQQAAVASARVGVAAEEVDEVARGRLRAAGYDQWFVHRTGHGIGVEEHEDPYIVAGNTTPLAAGNAFSVEPGIYRPGRWGLRLEDIVVASADGPDALNQAAHALVELDA